MRDALADQAKARAERKDRLAAARGEAPVFPDERPNRIGMTIQTGGRIITHSTSSTNLPAAHPAVEALEAERGKVQKLREDIEADPDAIRQQQLNDQLALLKHYERQLAEVRRIAFEQLNGEIIAVIDAPAEMPEPGNVDAARRLWGQRFGTGPTPGGLKGMKIATGGVVSGAPPAQSWNYAPAVIGTSGGMMSAADRQQIMDSIQKKLVSEGYFR